MKKLLAQIKLINSGKVVAENESSILFRASNYQGVVTPLIGYISVYQDPDTQKYTINGPVYLNNLDSIPASLTGNWAAFDEFVNSNGDYPVYTVREVVTLENGKKAFLYNGYQFEDLTSFGDKLSIGQMTSGFTPLSWDVDLRETYFQLDGKTVKGTNATQITDDFPDIPIDAYVWDNGVYSNDCYEFTDLDSSSSVAALLPFDYDPNKAYLFKAKLKSNSFESPGNGLCFISFDCFAIPAGGEGMPYQAFNQYDVLFTEDRRISVENQYVNLTSEKTLELNTWYWFFISFNENNSCCYLYIKEASETDQIENVTFESTDLVFVLDGVAEPAGDYQDIHSSSTISEVLSRGYTVQLKNTAMSTALNPYKFCFPSGSGDPVKTQLTRSDLTPPNKYYISIGSTPNTASITITSTTDSTKTTTATGQASLFLNDGESATVTVSLDGYTTVEKTITIDSANYKEMITLEELVTFTITPTPSDATVKINNVVQNSVEVVKGSTVTWSVEKTGYVTQSGEEVVNEDTTKTITLVEEPPRTELTLPTDTFYAWFKPINSLKYSLTETPGSNDWMYDSMAQDMPSINVGRESSGESGVTFGHRGAIVDGDTFSIGSSTPYTRDTKYDGEFYFCKAWMSNNWESYVTKKEIPESGDVVYSHDAIDTGAITNAGTVGTEWTYNSSTETLTNSNTTLRKTTDYIWVKASALKENTTPMMYAWKNEAGLDPVYYTDTETPIDGTKIYKQSSPTEANYIGISVGDDNTEYDSSSNTIQILVPYSREPSLDMCLTKLD